MKTNEEGEVWLEKVQAYVCPSYLNKTCTDFSDTNSEWLYNLYQKHYMIQILTYKHSSFYHFLPIDILL